MKKKLTANDFSAINFGILTASVGEHDFVFQRPFFFDKVRAAQESCVLFINHEKMVVEEFDDALEKCNKFLENN